MTALALVAITGCGGLYLGIQIEDTSSGSGGAVLVTEVDAGGLAGVAGMEPNDVIVRFNLLGVSTVAGLRTELAEMTNGDAISIKVYRISTGQTEEFPINLVYDVNQVPTSLGIDITTSAAPSGVEIVSVEADSPADDGGLMAGYFITKFGSTAIADVDQFRNALAATKEGDIVSVTFRRTAAGEDETTDVEIDVGVVSKIPLLGITVQDLSTELAREIGYPALGGVRATAVLIGGTAFDAGIMPNDRIFQFGNTQIDDVSELAAAVSQTGGSGTYTVGYSRGGDIFTPDVTLRGSLSGQDYTLDVGLSMVEVFGGLLVVDVVSGSAASDASIQVDDTVIEVWGRATATVQDFYEVLDDAWNARDADGDRLEGVSITTIRSGVQVSRYLQIRSSSGGEESSEAKEVPLAF